MVATYHGLEIVNEIKKKIVMSFAWRKDTSEGGWKDKIENRILIGL